MSKNIDIELLKIVLNFEIVLRIISVKNSGKNSVRNSVKNSVKVV